MRSQPSSHDASEGSYAVRTISVIVLERHEWEAIGRVVSSLRIAYPDDHWDDPEPRAVRALAAQTDATYEILAKAQIALRKQHEICIRESDVEHWTHALAVGDPITPDTPGDGMVTNPYQACTFLATARKNQAEEAREALVLVDLAIARATRRPVRSEFV